MPRFRKSNRLRPTPPMPALEPEPSFELYEPASAGASVRKSVRLVTPLFWIASSSMATTGLARSYSLVRMRVPETTIASSETPSELSQAEASSF